MVLARVEKVIKTMLSDTIMALCRNTLPYDAEFSVEGLIGITMDSKEIFLVNLNETVQKEGVLNIRKRDRNSRDSNAKEKSSQDSENDISCDDEGNSSSKRKRRRRRRRSKESDSLDSNDSDSDHNDDSSNMSGVFPAQPSNDEQETSAQGAVKRERKDSDDIVFVKEEPYVDNHASYSDTASQPMDSSHMFVGQNVSTSDIQLQELALQLSAGDMSSSGSQGQQGNVPPSSFPPLPPDGSQQEWGRLIPGPAQSHCMCSVCGKYLSSSKQLRMHLRVHTGEKPYHCVVCGKMFNCSANLSRHKRIHTGEKPYSCTKCEARFSQSTHLKKHLAKHQFS